ncbi:hydrolase, NUDIX family [gut metagenome]|uniref:Hydrolase, NUDIX family n=1 Tax=gut metagenome TaxID=749906 RepID=J9D8S3_9ZZZZ
MTHPLSQFLYCPQCGSAHFEINDEKSKKCAQCGFVYYFNSAAATVAFILNEKEELLVCRRAKEPAKGTLDLPGGFIDRYETAEEGVAREVKEETGLTVNTANYLFTIPNVYIYSGFAVHTLDLFFRCTVSNLNQMTAMDDVADSFFVPLNNIHPEEFGLDSVRKGVEQFLAKHQTKLR